MSKHVSISPEEAADRLVIRELIEAYAHCADRRDAKGQMSLFTADTHFGRMAAELRAGRVVINGMTHDPQSPWGGFKYFGVGREYGRYGIEAFFERRAILGA